MSYVVNNCSALEKYQINVVNDKILLFKTIYKNIILMLDAACFKITHILVIFRYFSKC